MKYIIADKNDSERIKAFLYHISDEFPISLTEKTDISSYVDKVLNFGVILLAEENGEIAGINMMYANDAERKLSWISTLGVDIKYRRKGVAMKLLRLAEEKAFWNGMSYLVLYVHKANNVAISAYKKFGFTETDEIPPNADYNITLIKKIRRD